jgi:hypothetical protein
MSIFITIPLRNEEVQKHDMGLTKFIFCDTLESGEINQDTTVSRIRIAPLTTC